MRTPTLKFFLLRLLERGPKSGYELMKEIEELLGRVSPGAVYPLLRWWEERGVVEKRDKYYLTEKGRKLLSELEKKRNEYIERAKRDLLALARTLRDPEMEKLVSYLPLRDKIGERGMLVLGRLVELLVECKDREKIVERLRRVVEEEC